MNNVGNIARELADSDACSLMELFNHGDWMTRDDWAKLVQTASTDLNDEAAVLTDDDLSDIDRMVTDFLADGLILEADNRVAATPRARAVLEQHSLGFTLRQ